MIERERESEKGDIKRKRQREKKNRIETLSVTKIDNSNFGEGE